MSLMKLPSFLQVYAFFVHIHSKCNKNVNVVLFEPSVVFIQLYRKHLRNAYSYNENYKKA